MKSYQFYDFDMQNKDYSLYFLLSPIIQEPDNDMKATFAENRYIKLNK